MNKHLRTVLAILITVTTLAGSAIPSSAQRVTPAQNETTFVSEVTGSTIDLGDSGEAWFQYDLHEVSDVGLGVQQEAIWLQVGWSQIAISFFSDNEVDPISYFQNSIESLASGDYTRVVVLGEEVATDQSWYLTRQTWEHGATEFGYSETYRDIGNGTTTAIIIFSHSSTLTDHIGWAQQHLMIDGFPVFTDTDLNGIQAMLDGTSPIEPTVISDNVGTVSDWEDFGLVSETEWHDQPHGTDVTWDDELWYFPLGYRNAITYSGDDYAAARLRSVSREYSVLITLWDNPEGRTGKDLETRWISDEWLEEAYPDRSVLGSRSTHTTASVIYLTHTLYDEPVIVQRESINLDNGVIVFLEIESTPDTASKAYEATIDGIQINGESFAKHWSQPELDDVFSGVSEQSGEAYHRSRSSREADAATPQPDRSNHESGTEETDAPQDWSEMGLVSETEWQSPLSNTSFTWDGDLWVFPEDREDAITINDGFTALILETPDGQGEVILSTDTGGIPISDWFNFILSDEWASIQEKDGQPFTVIDSFSDNTTASVILIHHAEGGDLVVIIDIYENNDGVTILTEITATPDDIADVYTDFWEGVQSNGDYYPLTWTIEEIELLELD